MPLPQCEAHVRPLVGLHPDRAQEVWLEALAKAPKGQVTARLIQRLVKRMKRAEGIQAAESKQNPQQRFETRRSVRNGLQELLTLLMQRAEHDLLIGKVLSLQRLLEPLLNPRKTKK